MASFPTPRPGVTVALPATVLLALALFALAYHPGTAKSGASRCLTIAEIQGPGAFSAYDGRDGLACVQGCVTGVAADGFYLQSISPDTNPATSEGIFVYRWSGWTNPRGLKAGDWLEITDFGVQEFYDSTEIVKLKSDRNTAYRRLGACALPAPIPAAPLTDPQTDPVRRFEALEGMRVVMDLDAIVTGPTARYPSRYPAGDPEIALVSAASPLAGRRLFAGDVPVGRGMIYLSGGLGRDLPDVAVGDRVTASGLTGVLAYQFGRYVLLVDNAAPALTVQAAPTFPSQASPIGPDEFALCSYNAENFFDAVDDGDGDMGDWSPSGAAAFNARLRRTAAILRDALQHCTVIGLQEIEGKDAVWRALADAAGGYRFDYYESADSRDITVGILYDPARVTVRSSKPSQACTAQDFGVKATEARGPRARPYPCPKGFLLFERPPYVADLTVRDAAGEQSLDVRVVVNHFKSRRGDETVNRVQRLAQAQHVAGLLSAPNSVALGDLNDLPSSPTLDAFTAYADLYDTHVPRNDRYTYIFNGLAESPDYAIVTPELLRRVAAAGPVHVNADFPESRDRDAPGRISDHDPLFVRLTFGPGRRGLNTGRPHGMIP